MSVTRTTPDTLAASVTGTDRAGTRIVLEQVTKDYGLPDPAVDQVSLTIAPGEFMTLLGPSGSGKTTTLNLIAGFETLTAGSIAFDGTDVGSLPPHKRNLGMLFQNYALFPHMTVAQNVGYPLRERRMPKSEVIRKVAEVLELVQLTGRDGHYPTQLSGGQQQRVALARAIVYGPRALLLDEPLGALDRNLRGALQAEIRRIHREVGSTFVFVTHDQEEAMSLSDRIALFNRGRIEQLGTPEELYRAPETLFTARFLGDSLVFEPLGGDERVGQWHEHSWSLSPGTVAEGASDGDRALVVRPEDVRLVLDPDDVPSGASSVPAHVVSVEFLGAYRSATLSIGAEGLTGLARLDSQALDVSPGDSVVAWWPVEQQRVVRRSA